MLDDGDRDAQKVGQHAKSILAGGLAWKVRAARPETLHLSVNGFKSRTFGDSKRGRVKKSFCPLSNIYRLCSIPGI